MSLPYRADWSTGMGGWTGSEDWVASQGALLSRGQDSSTQAGVTAPIDLVGVDAYAVEAEIELVRYTDAGAMSGSANFGVVVRSTDGVGYGAGHCVSAGIYSCAGGQPSDKIAFLWTNADFNQTVLDMAPFTPGPDRHRYRVEVRGNSLTFLIDGAPVLQVTDNTYLDGGRVGLWTNRAQVSVHSFEVTAL